MLKSNNLKLVHVFAKDLRLSEPKAQNAAGILEETIKESVSRHMGHLATKNDLERGLEKLETSTSREFEKFEASTSREFEKFEASTKREFEKFEANTKREFEKIEASTKREFEKIETRFEKIETRIEKLETKFDTFKDFVTDEFKSVRTSINKSFWYLLVGFPTIMTIIEILRRYYFSKN